MESEEREAEAQVNSRKSSHSAEPRDSEPFAENVSDGSLYKEQGFHYSWDIVDGDGKLDPRFFASYQVAPYVYK